MRSWLNTPHAIPRWWLLANTATVLTLIALNHL